MINPHHLKYFVDAAAAGSLSEAAKQNRVSQSAISQAIRALEKSIGYTLTTHQKTLQLTDEGNAVLERAGEVFRSMAALSSAAGEAQSVHSGTVVIGCTGTVAHRLIPELLSRLCAIHPKLRPIVRIGNSETIKAWLLEREVELGIFVDDGKLGQDFHRKLIRRGEYVLIRGRAAVKKNAGLVVTRSDRAEVAHFQKHLDRKRYGGQIECEITSWEAIAKYVAMSQTLGICPDYVIEQAVADRDLKIVEVPFKNPSYSLIATHLVKSPLGKNGRMVLNEILSGRVTDP